MTAGLCGADLDGDGRVDLVALSGGTPRWIVLLNGPGGYRAAGGLDAGPSASGCATGDFNGDGKPDLAVSHHDDDELWLFMGKGDGTFSAPSTVRVPVTKPHAHMVLVADANGDGRADLFLAQADDNEVWVLLADGKGGFAPSASSPIATGNHPYTIAASDFDGDGRLDFATPNWYGKSVSVFLGDGEGGFAAAPGSPLEGFSAPTALGAADLNADGHVDLAVGNDDSRRVQILVGDGRGGFASGVIADLVAEGDCFTPTLADLDADGKIDVIATAVNDAPTFSYWINLGGGEFAPAQVLSCPSVASRICVIDTDADGAQDLVVGSWNDATIRIWSGKRAER